MKLFAKPLCSASLVLLALVYSPMAAELLTLQYESAPTAEGPWNAVDPAKLQVQPNGTATLDATEAQLYFRLRISGTNEVGSLPLLRLADLPPSTLEAARRHVREITETGVENPASRADLDDAEAWVGAEFAPFA